MKFKFLITYALALPALLSNAQQTKAQVQAKTTNISRPKLVVGITVDQMRWDYLYRYYERYGNTGFKRMLNEGFSCDNTYINYIPSNTGVGHATVYTGSVPAIHGIAGNEWIIQATGESMYCVADSTVSTVGSSSVGAGKMSPWNLLTTSLTDELRLATNFRSKVIAIALKDIGSILPGGHSANAAYWYDGGSGNFITRTYYMQSLPVWVSGFNEQNLPEKYIKQDWNTLYPINTYLQSSKDDNTYEGKFPGTTSSVFPIKTSELPGKASGKVANTPYGNTLTLEMAKAAIENEALGADPITDFLAVSLSTPDYIGHRFGPNSIEVEDNYLRLDRDLATFFGYLDSKVGKGNYTVFLTADHAAQQNAGFMADNKIQAGVFTTTAHLNTLNSLLEKEFNSKNIIKSFSNYQVTLNYDVINSKKLDEADIKARAIKFLKKQDGVAFVIDTENAQSATIPALYKETIINGYNPERSGVIQIILKPAWYSGSSARATGATHGSLNPGDTHIPLIFMGWGIKQGKSNNPYQMTDIAPTITGLLHVQEPNGNIGKAISEVMK